MKKRKKNEEKGSEDPSFVSFFKRNYFLKEEIWKKWINNMMSSGQDFTISLMDNIFSWKL